MHRILVAAVSTGILLGTSTTALIASSGPLGDRRATAPSGRVHGFVRDAAGLALPDVSVLAVGLTVVAARSDANGRFQMTVPAGDYILRATRSGYVSNYREPVRVQGAVQLERVITLVRQGDLLAASKQTDEHAHTELAWRLRHLPRSVLRDAAGQPDWTEHDGTGRVGRRAGSSLLGQFTGQVHFVTTASGTPATFSTSVLPRSVAYVVLGAPAGGGDWRIRGAIGSGTESSWNLLGEYEAHRTEAHALRVGLSYSSHGPRVPGVGLFSRAALEARSVAGVFVEDRWKVLPDLDVEYGMRADRYDFLAEPYLVSARAAMRARVFPATSVIVRAGRSMLAPGAEEFLPPPADGPWLPPERTFASLAARDLMRAETVRHVEFGVAHEFGRPARAAVIQARAFSQVTTDQIATLFSAQDTRTAGHYRVARAGDVVVSGYAAGVGGKFLRVLSGKVEYARMSADWHTANRTRGLRRFAPGVVRTDREWLDDVTALLEAKLNEERTRVSFVYRTNTAFSGRHGTLPGPGARFDFQLHQALPYRPTINSRLELLFAVRTLFRDPQSGASPYDELLTVSPPLRLMGGIQVKF